MSCSLTIVLGNVLRLETYSFRASATTFLQAGISLSLCLARQAMIRPPPGTMLLRSRVRVI